MSVTSTIAEVLGCTRFNSAISGNAKSYETFNEPITAYDTVDQLDSEHGPCIGGLEGFVITLLQ